MGPGVHIYTVGHPVQASLRDTFYEKGTPVIIGNNVWIGGRVTILPGVVIGDKCVIGAGAVVTKSIPPNSLAVGNPAIVMKTIIDATNEERNEFLNKYQ